MIEKAGRALQCKCASAHATHRLHLFFVCVCACVLVGWCFVPIVGCRSSGIAPFSGLVRSGKHTRMIPDVQRRFAREEESGCVYCEPTRRGEVPGTQARQ